MKHSAAILGILCLLLLSSCRVQGPEEGGAPTGEPSPSQSVPPAQSSPLPEASESAPVDTPTPTVPLPPQNLTAEELTALSLEWSESEAASFAGYAALAHPRRYWFADYAAGAELVPYTASDGQDGSAKFLGEGALSPEEAAARLLEQSADLLIVVDRDRALEGLSRRMAALAEEGVDEAAALDRFRQAAQDIPALGEDMWYCVSAEDTGYILMKQEGTYRLQRMVAMLEYADAPEFQVRIAFDKAAEAWGWFYTAAMDPAQTGFTSMLELRSYLKTLFSDEIVDALLGLDYYKDVDGVLQATAFEGGGALPQGEGAVVRESDRRLVYRLEADFVYVLVGDKWVFTQFPAPG